MNTSKKPILQQRSLLLAAACVAAATADTASAWDPVKDLTGKPLHEHGEHIMREISNAPRSWSDCALNPGACVEKNVNRVAYAAFWPIIERYKAHLFNQGNGRWRSLPESMIAAAQPHYPEINLRSVRYVEGVDTLHGLAITWHYSIFFPDRVDLNDYEGVRLMLHELEHVVQYERRGGEQAFISEYILKVPGKVIERGSFDVHDHVDIERAADRKANDLVEQVFSAVDDWTRHANQARALPPRASLPASAPQFANFCLTPAGRFGPGPMQYVGSSCWVMTAYGPIGGRVGF